MTTENSAAVQEHTEIPPEKQQTVPVGINSSNMPVFISTDSRGSSGGGCELSG